MRINRFGTATLKVQRPDQDVTARFDVWSEAQIIALRADATSA